MSAKPHEITAFLCGIVLVLSGLYLWDPYKWASFSSREISALCVLGAWFFLTLWVSWPLVWRIMRCCWGNDKMPVKDKCFPLANGLVLSALVGGGINFYWAICFKALHQYTVSSNYSSNSHNADSSFAFYFLGINGALLLLMFYFSRMLKRAGGERNTADCRRVLFRLPWLQMLMSIGFALVFIVDSFIKPEPIFDQVRVVFYLLVFSLFLLELPVLWYLVRESEMTNYSFCGYGIGCQRGNVMTRWFALAFLRCLFVLFYFFVSIVVLSLFMPLVSTGGCLHS